MRRKERLKGFLAGLILLIGGPGMLFAQQAQVAGSFYPEDAPELERQLTQFLETSLTPTQSPRILLVPHAGYDYSGSTAGTGYQLIPEKAASTVIVLGVAHQYSRIIEGALLIPEGHFETPLGKIEIDANTTKRLMEISKNIQSGPTAFFREHSVEVELPFLQKKLPGFQLVPLVMNKPDLAYAKEVGEAIAQVMRENEKEGKKTLLVISSDLAHYPTLMNAEISDAAMLKYIESADPEGLFNASQAMMQKGIPDLLTTMCGEAGVLAGLFAAKALGISGGKILRHTTSASAAAGDPGRVVGYAAAVFYDAPAEIILTTEEKKTLLEFARASVKAAVEKKQDLEIPKGISGAFEIPRAVFVTIRKKGELRGCIGSTGPVWPLAKAVQYYAKEAAFEDPRFSPVTADELDSLSFEISILSPRKQVRDASLIQPGIGVVLAQGSRMGVFLPLVWKETGWDKETFLNELASQKAGLPKDAWKDPRTELYTFTADTFEEE